ncbi:maleylpyruvate isomerase family mycothiol-dependent enzyme [Frankia sp. Cas3]|uniref:maleylpyruvate isomerase family mycothiol-dependent enzyme n=2 Tax=unclassified Frankia TaxID=2632575 RepID=UPI002AD458E3|nr:maleylpyruvate isomerase family mycothiol-dependent enzyme [Frankia sp. Cas3]
MSARKVEPHDLAPAHPLRNPAPDGHGGHVDDLLGAYLLGACDPDETVIVDTHLGRCEHCLVTAETLSIGLVGLVGRQRHDLACEVSGDMLRDVADEIAAEAADAVATEVDPAGSAALAAVMAAALTRRPATPVAPEIADPYLTQVGAVDRLLAELTADDWTREIVNGWNTRELVAHLAASDGLVAAGIGLAVDPPVHSTDLDERTAAVHAHQHDWTTGRTWSAWYGAMERIAEQLRRSGLTDTDGPTDTDDRRAPFGPLGAYLTIRAFETWIHGRDIAERVGLAMPLPPADHLHRMADTAMRWLTPKVRAALPPASGDATLLVNLSGPGGGRWMIGPDGTSEIAGSGKPPATSAAMSAPLLDFCLLVADRRQAGDIGAELVGDTAIAQAMLDVAPSFAGA